MDSTELLAQQPVFLFTARLRRFGAACYVTDGSKAIQVPPDVFAVLRQLRLPVTVGEMLSEAFESRQAEDAMAFASSLGETLLALEMRGFLTLYTSDFDAASALAIQLLRRQDVPVLGDIPKLAGWVAAVERLFQVLGEACTLREDPTLGAEFSRRLGAAYRVLPAAVDKFVRTELQCVDWSYRSDSGLVTVRFKDAVYEGYVGHRG
jgi:hypothetical protein